MSRNPTGGRTKGAHVRPGAWARLDDVAVISPRLAARLRQALLDVNYRDRMRRTNRVGKVLAVLCWVALYVAMSRAGGR